MLECNEHSLAAKLDNKQHTPVRRAQSLRNPSSFVRGNDVLRPSLNMYASVLDEAKIEEREADDLIISSVITPRFEQYEMVQSGCAVHYAKHLLLHLARGSPQQTSTTELRAAPKFKLCRSGWRSEGS